jgi:hypothetical protein
MKKMLKECALVFVGGFFFHMAAYFAVNLFIIGYGMSHFDSTESFPWYIKAFIAFNEWLLVPMVEGKQTESFFLWGIYSVGWGIFFVCAFLVIVRKRLIIASWENNAPRKDDGFSRK